MSPLSSIRVVWSSSLRTVLPLSLAALLPVALLAGSSIELASNQIRGEVEKRVQATAAVSSVFVGLQTSGLTALVHSQANRPDLTVDMAAGSAGRPAVTRYLRSLSESALGTRGAFLVDLEGTLLDVYPAAPGLPGRSFAFRDWYYGLVSSGAPYVSEAYRSALPGEPLVVGVADYVREPGGRPVAIIVAIQDLDVIEAFATNIARAQGIKLTVTDWAGTVLSAGSRRGLVSASDDPRVRAAAVGGTGLMSYIPVSGQAGQGSRELSAYTSVPSTRWTVTASVSERVAFAGLDRLRAAVLGITAVLVLVLIAGAIATARAQRRRRESEMRVRRRDEQLSKVLEATGEAFISLDDAGAVAAWSTRAEQLFGWPARDVLGRKLSEVVIMPAQREAHTRGLRHYAVGAPSAIVGSRVEVTALHHEGHEVPVELRVWAHEDGSGFSALVHDITERVASAAALAAARDQAMQASRLKGEFLATMSHEIRTPMNAVIGMTGLLLDTDLNERQREFSETVRDSGEALLEVINNILDLSKIEAGELGLEVHPFDLRECVESAVGLVSYLAGSKDLELVADLDDSCPVLVTGDLTRFRQVIVNLLSNAVKFTDPGGEVVVAVRAQPDGPAQVGVTVSVSDTGIGIPADRVDRLFQPFSQIDSSTTRTHGGTGLGLVISRRLASAMGGDLHVTSQPGTGSTFTFTAVLQTFHDRRGATDPLAGSLRERRALIVDDNATNRRVLSRLLESWGMTCIQAATPAAALELLGGGRQVDVAVLDMHMPGMDGRQLAAAIRGVAQCRDLPLLLLTSLQWHGDATDRSLFDGTLTKPAKSSVLREKLLSALAPTDAALAAVESAGGRRNRDVPAVDPPALRILLAEDNPVNQRVAQLLLRNLGYEVDIVGDGQQAVRAVHRGGYDVVLMDVQMPGMDGLQATREIRADLPKDSQPQIIAMTASYLVEDRAACESAGMDAYLPKPVRPDDLADLLRQVAPRPARTAHTSSDDAVASRAEAVRRRLDELSGSDPVVDRELYSYMLQFFLSQGPQLLDELTDAARRGAARDAELAAHSLKGSAANLGGIELAALLQAVELQAVQLQAGAQQAGELQVGGDLADLEPVRQELEVFSAAVKLIADELDPQPHGSAGPLARQ